MGSKKKCFLSILFSFVFLCTPQKTECMGLIASWGLSAAVGGFFTWAFSEKGRDTLKSTAWTFLGLFAIAKKDKEAATAHQRVNDANIEMRNMVQEQQKKDEQTIKELTDKLATLKEQEKKALEETVQKDKSEIVELKSEVTLLRQEKIYLQTTLTEINRLADGSRSKSIEQKNLGSSLVKNIELIKQKIDEINFDKNLNNKVEIVEKNPLPQNISYNQTNVYNLPYHQNLIFPKVKTNLIDQLFLSSHNATLAIPSPKTNSLPPINDSNSLTFLQQNKSLIDHILNEISNDTNLMKTYANIILKKTTKIRNKSKLNPQVLIPGFMQNNLQIHPIQHSPTSMSLPRTQTNTTSNYSDPIVRDPIIPSPVTKTETPIKEITKRSQKDPRRQPYSLRSFFFGSPKTPKSSAVPNAMAKMR